MQTPQALNAAFASGKSHDVIVETLRFAGANRVLDVGCGKGRLVARLIAEGFEAAGTDPNPRALESARANAPGARFADAGAEMLPFDDDGFDAVVFLNSFHHVPVDRMRQALAEARRIGRRGCPLVIVEPLAEGSYFEAMQPVEDETAIRHAAGVAIADAVRAGWFGLKGNVVFETTSRFANVQEFVDGLIAVDPARRASAERHKSEVERRFRECSQKDEGGFRLMQPLRIYWLAVQKN
ncbi:class I SAM-dependent methyltransferase [Jiella avicenniae]|uniref:Class I SAM-dependent methyltransferase n=1 Tax=Jiella avicenniae TaxID=2907202 RepID=A0A9X1T6E5_9HYPH|nr:class I SAM-dependent methyltransferase [Jiella avicenniae]MCE7030521.1 class I SAM-dependent methyltransferase [Jiella avicenniae]